MRSLTTTRRTCSWSTCRACRATGFRDGGVAAWDRYFQVEVELAEEEDRVYTAYKAGEATSEDITAALEELAHHLQSGPETCRDCLGAGVRRGRRRSTRRRAWRRP